jgi:hypothetical protein
MPAPYATLTPELEAAVTQDFFSAFQAQFGEEWRRCLHKNLRPSPNKELAQRYNLPLEKIRLVKQNIWSIGLMLRNIPGPTDAHIAAAQAVIHASLQAFVDGTPIGTVATQMMETPLEAAEAVAAAPPP